MAYRFVFTKTAKNDIEKLDTTVKKRLRKKFEYFAASKDISMHAKKLTNSKAGEFRLRVGDYRAIFDLRGATVVVLRVQHRRDIYRNL